MPAPQYASLEKPRILHCAGRWLIVALMISFTAFFVSMLHSVNDMDTSGPSYRQGLVEGRRAGSGDARDKTTKMNLKQSEEYARAHIADAPDIADPPSYVEGFSVGYYEGFNSYSR